MRSKVSAQFWWTLVSLAVLALTIATPAILPLVPPTEKECKDEININVCEFVNHVRTHCCLSRMLFDCEKVEMWKHKTDGTYHFRNPDKCDNLEIACIPYNNHCD